MQSVIGRKRIAAKEIKSGNQARGWKLGDRKALTLQKIKDDHFHRLMRQQETIVQELLKQKAGKHFWATSRRQNLQQI